MAYCCIYQLVYPRQRERIFWTGFVQVCEIYTHLPLPIFLFHYHGVGQPLEVVHFLNSPYLLKLPYLISNSIRMIFGWASRWLLSGGDRWINIQMMADEVWIHPWGFISVPCKRINIFPKELYQLFSLLGRQLSPNLKELLWIITNNHLF